MIPGFKIDSVVEVSSDVYANSSQANTIFVNTRTDSQKISLVLPTPSPSLRGAILGGVLKNHDPGFWDSGWYLVGHIDGINGNTFWNSASGRWASNVLLYCDGATWRKLN